MVIPRSGLTKHLINKIQQVITKFNSISFTILSLQSVNSFWHGKLQRINKKNQSLCGYPTQPSSPFVFYNRNFILSDSDSKNFNLTESLWTDLKRKFIKETAITYRYKISTMTNSLKRELQVEMFSKYRYRGGYLFQDNSEFLRT